MLSLVITASPAAADSTTLYAYAAGGATSPTSCPETDTTSDQCTLAEALSLVGPGGTVALATAGSSAYYVGNWSLTTAGTTASLPVTIEPAPGVAAALAGSDVSGSDCQTSTCDGPVLSIGSGVYADIEGIDVAYARSQADGGAIDNAGTLAVSGSTFVGNFASSGGSIYNTGTLTVSGSSFTGGEAYQYEGYEGGYGGAIYNSGTFAVSTSAFVGGEANAVFDEYGGSIYNTGTGTVSASTFTDNKAQDGYGGAIANPGTLTVSASTFWGNTADYGGAIYNGLNGSTSGTLTVSASTFSANTATYDDTSGTIANPGDGTVGVAADIFDGSCDQGSNWDDEGYNVGSDESCLGGGPADDNYGASLTSLLSALGANGGPTETMLPLAGNPAIGIVPSGTTVTLDGNQVSLCPTTDQRGEETISGQACNAGAVQSGLLYAEYPVTSGSSPDVIVSGLNGNLVVHRAERGQHRRGHAFGPGDRVPSADLGKWARRDRRRRSGGRVVHRGPSRPDRRACPSEATTTLPDPGITEYPVKGELPTEIAEGPDGNMWFTEFGSANIGKITPSGQVTQYPVPGGDNPDGITEGPDGNMWFTDWAWTGSAQTPVRGCHAVPTAHRERPTGDDHRRAGRRPLVH